MLSAWMLLAWMDFFWYNYPEKFGVKPQSIRKPRIFQETKLFLRAIYIILEQTMFLGLAH
ncbi:MAG: hypothetical protein DRR19_24750 [Candidatus Parabeggiatoa sp. nov. 1]|nr:MAG: hypothetical protein DRR19_24750 [Gammaproteobacteria bacterium]